MVRGYGKSTRPQELILQVSISAPEPPSAALNYTNTSQ